MSADAGRLADGATVIFGIRPEAVNDPESVDRNAKSVATFDADVEIVEPAGSDTFVVIHVAGKEVTARMRADTDVSASDRSTPSRSISTRRCCSIRRPRGASERAGRDSVRRIEDDYAKRGAS